MTNKKYTLPGKTFFSAVSIATVLTIITIAVVNRASITKVAPSQAAGVNDVLSYVGLSNILTDLPTTVVNNATGVYTLQATTCTDPTKDRFEIQLSHRVNHIYGLGTNYTTGAVEVSDFVDTSFSSGHDSVSVPTNFVFNGDHGRGRRPVFILPEEHVIIAYLQPSVKIVRLTRDASSTVLVLKKHNIYTEGTCAPLVIIKGSSNVEMYKLYNQYLKQRFAFKKPVYNSTGLGWEAWAEYGCNATVTDIRNAFGSFKNAGIPISYIVDGSGFWNWQTGQKNGCSENVGRPDTPTMDALQVSPDRFISKLEWDRMIVDLKFGGVNFMIGMRNSVHPGNAANIESKIRAIAIGGTFMPATSPVFFNSTPMYGTIPSNNVRILNLSDSSVMNRYLQLLRGAYGNVGGFKEDEMIVGDQKAFTNNANAPNLPDDFVAKAYGYYKNISSDFIIWGPNDWFSAQTDIHNLPGYVPGHGEPYSLPFWIQNALSHSISGYPNVLMESDGNVQLKEGSPIAVQKEFLRDIQANIFMPAVSQSRGFWHLTDPAIKSKHIYFSQLRERLRRYIYDNAVKNYEDGVPSLLKPLFIDSDNKFTQDSNIFKLYSDEAFPVKYEYMFGNSLLIRPIVSASDTVTVYFPRGEWVNIFTGERFRGPALINLNFPYDQANYPAFAKAGEPFILQDVNDTFQNRVRIYPTNSYQTSYSHYNTAGNKVGTITVYLNNWSGDWSTIRVINSSGQAVAFTRSIKDEIVFNMLDGVSYSVFNQLAVTLTPSPSPTPTRTPSPTLTRSPSPTPTRSPSPSPTSSPTPSASPTHSPSPTPTSSASPSPTSSPIAYNCANQSFYSVNSLAYSYSKDCLSVPKIMYQNENRFNIFLTPNTVKNIPYIKTENLGIKEDQNLHWSITSQISGNVFVMYRKIPGQVAPAWIRQNYQKLTNDDYSNLQQFVLRKNDQGLIGVYDIYVKPTQANVTVPLGPATDNTVTAYSMYLVGLSPGL